MLLLHCNSLLARSEIENSDFDGKYRELDLLKITNNIITNITTLTLNYFILAGF